MQVQVFIDGQAVTVPERVEGWVFKAGEHYARAQTPAPAAATQPPVVTEAGNARGPEAAEAFLMLRGLKLWDSTRNHLGKLLESGAQVELPDTPMTGRTTARALYYLMRGGLPAGDPDERRAVLRAADMIRKMPQRATPVHPDGPAG